MQRRFVALPWFFAWPSSLHAFLSFFSRACSALLAVTALFELAWTLLAYYPRLIPHLQSHHGASQPPTLQQFNYHSLLAARIFLAIFKAAITPSLMLICSQPVVH